MTDRAISTKIIAWIRLSRPPFLSVGVLPFLLGTLLAWKLGRSFNSSVLFWGIFAVILIMISTYHAGEYFDYEGDRIAQRIHENRFAGGARVLQSGILSKSVAFWTGIITFAMAALIGLYIQFILNTGPYTILLGSLGIFPGFFYSTKPVRLVERGLGEISIGFCYGWLPIASAFYIQTAYIAPVIHWIGISIGLTIFNVILLNEFPDYSADLISGKRNLLVRAGMKAGVIIYIGAGLLTWMTILLTLAAGVPTKVLFFMLPVMVLSALIILMMAAGKYKDQKTLEILCGLNIAVNIGTSLAYIVAYW